MDKQKLIILTGPTAVGKTALSLELAKRINAEIISADSMQVYRHMDIGSAKIMPDQMQGIRHHLIDVLDPSESFNVCRFQTLATEALREIAGRGKLPLIVGGTGFYIQALLYDIDFSEEDSNGAYRKMLEEKAKEGGAHALYEMLLAVDQKSAENIHENNVKRVIRALEYHHDTGKKISEHNEEERSKESPYDFRYFVLTDDRKRIYENIDRRVDEMMKKGLLNEVMRLKEMGYTPGLVSMQGLGYKELMQHLEGAYDLPRAVSLIKQKTRHYAKRQMTWFRRERDVIFIEKAGRTTEELVRELMKYITDFKTT